MFKKTLKICCGYFALTVNHFIQGMKYLRPECPVQLTKLHQNTCLPVCPDQNIYLPSGKPGPQHLFALQSHTCLLIHPNQHTYLLSNKPSPEHMFALQTQTNKSCLPYTPKSEHLFTLHTNTDQNTIFTLSSEHHIYRKLKPQQKFMSCFVQLFVMLILMHAFIVLALF